VRSIVAITSDVVVAVMVSMCCRDTRAGALEKSAVACVAYDRHDVHQVTIIVIAIIISSLLRPSFSSTTTTTTTPPHFLVSHGHHHHCQQRRPT
jgi:hypothetical protein